MILLLPLLLSEVLANEPGGAVALEWIEVEATMRGELSSYELVINGDVLALPSVTIDSGEYLVICRDTVRFEEHVGDSSGSWGDSEVEAFRRIQVGMSLPNSTGTIELQGPAGTDRFVYTGSAPDGVSYERIGDTLWQVTDEYAGATPGRRNHGRPAHFDWRIVQAKVDLPGEAIAVLKVQMENRGIDSSATTATIADSLGHVHQWSTISGEAGAVLEVTLEAPAYPGANHLQLYLSPDERPAGDTLDLLFFTPPLPVFISEIYAVPAGSEPEWVELAVHGSLPIDAADLELTDGRDTAAFLQAEVVREPGSWIIVTSDSTGFRQRYPDNAARVWQATDWPVLNNDGDTLALLLSGAVVERAGYPSSGSRRGVALERIGSSHVWAYAVTSDGATPGRKNSVDVPYNDALEISLAPNPFAPGAGESVQVSFVVPFASMGDIRLFRGDGCYVCTLHEEGPLVSGAITWDGRDSRGRTLPVGIYLLQFRLTKPRELTRLTTVVVAR